MLRKTRILFATVMFIGVTLLFLDFTGTLHSWLGWMAKIQFWPAFYALNIGVVIGIIALTLVFGRIYCSVICPLGILQDIISKGRSKMKRNRFSYSPEKKILRYAMLLVFIASALAGVNIIVSLLAPYSSYGRMVASLLLPVWQWGNNLLAMVAEHYDSYAFYSTEVWMRSTVTVGIAVATLLIIIVLAVRGGRTYCNTICPVGTILSIFARHSYMKVHFNSDKCVNCGLCARNCKAACIDFKNHEIDYSRCVTCGDCIDKCKHDALTFGHKAAQKAKSASTPEQPDTNKKSTEKETVDTSRRSFLLASAMATTAAATASAQAKLDGGLAEIEDKEAPKRETPLTPPGSLSAKNMAQHCTSCQLCISHARMVSSALPQTCPH